MSDRMLYRSELVDPGNADGSWTTVAPRKELEPGFLVDDAVGGWGDEAAALQIRLPEVTGGQGKWVRRLEPVVGGVSYRFSARFQSRGVSHPRSSVYARVIWQGADGESLSHDKQEYFAADAAEGTDSRQWSTITGVRKAPDDAGAAVLQLAAAWAPGAQVWFSGIEWVELAPPSPRSITVAAVYLQPRSPSTPEDNVDRFCAMIDEAGQSGADLCVLPEAMTVVGVPDRTPAEVAETIPGPLSRRLGEHARQSEMYVVACYPEREDRNVYNTAVLLDRAGRLVGKYRKTHLPNEEVDAGYTPGDDYPVFDTDFGKVGMMICWDVAFPEPARALAVAGAEILLMPIWGGNETLMAARAIENAVYLVSSSYNAPTGIVDPLGAWQVVIPPSEDRAVAAQGQLAMATIDLGDRKRWSWVGDFSQRLHIERRPDLVNALKG